MNFQTHDYVTVSSWHEICFVRWVTSPINFNSGIDYMMAQKAMEHAILQHKVISSNIINQETPGYKRMEVESSFKAKLQQCLQKPEAASALDSIKPTVAKDSYAPVVRPDGNNVSIDKELMAMNENSLNFEFAADYLTDSIKRIQTAISGRTS